MATVEGTAAVHEGGTSPRVAPWALALVLISTMVLPALLLPAYGQEEGRPGPPTDLTAVEEGGVVVLTWVAPEDVGGTSITRYNVLRGDSELELTVLQWTVGTTFTDGDVEPNNRYHYAVSAENANGTGPLSNIASVEVPGEPGEGIGGLPTWVVMTILGIVALVLVILLLRPGGRRGGPEAMAPMGKEPEPEVVAPPVMAERAARDVETTRPSDRTTP